MVPSVSVEVEPLTDTTRSLTVRVNAAVGAWLTGGAVTVNVAVSVSVAPSSSVTVRVTVFEPAVA